MNKNGMLLSFLGLVLLAWMSAAQADIVPNQNFEENNGLTAEQLAAAFVTLQPGSTNITAWVVKDHPIDYVGPNMWKNYFDRSVHLKNLGAIQTTLNTVVGAKYTLEFDIDGNWAGGNETKYMQVSATGNLPQVYGTSKPSWWDPANQTTFMNWTDWEYVFTATGTQTLLTFASLETNDFGPALDDPKIIGVTNPVPLPGALVLLGTGLLTLAGFRRKLKR
jgi:hypothetical protein